MSEGTEDSTDGDEEEEGEREEGEGGEVWEGLVVEESDVECGWGARTGRLWANINIKININLLHILLFQTFAP